MGSSAVSARTAVLAVHRRAATIVIQQVALAGRSDLRSTGEDFRLKGFDGQHEDIPYATLGANDTRGARVCLKFATQAQDLHIDAAVEDVLVHASRLQ